MVATDEIIVKCPHCGAKLGIKSRSLDQNSKIRCPNCKTIEPFSKYIQLQRQVQDDDDETYKSSRGGDDTELNIVGKGIGTLVDNSTGRSYRLSEGLNTIGRKSSTSSASVQIQTSDMCMSRNHIAIEVVRTRNSYSHVCYNTKNKNATLVNGVELTSSDKVILMPSDKILLGNTELVFKI